MDLKELISSGLLESYVLGTAAPQEAAKIHALTIRHPELLLEIESIENSLLAAAEQSAPRLRPQVKEALLKKIELSGHDNVVPLNGAVQRNSSPAAYKYGMAAALALLLGSALVNVLMYNKLNGVEQQVADLNNEKSVMASQMQVNATSLQETKKSLAFMADTMVKAVHLKPMPKMPASLATVYWNSGSKEVYLNVMELPAPPEGKQYQLWALANGQPVDAGVFSVTDTLQLQKLKDISSAQAFAVTLEKQGGSPTPTLSEMYMMGTLQ